MRDDLLTRAASLLKLAKGAPSARIILGVYPFGELIVKLFCVFGGLHGTKAPPSRAFNTREHTAVDIEAHAHQNWLCGVQDHRLPGQSGPIRCGVLRYSGETIWANLALPPVLPAFAGCLRSAGLLDETASCAALTSRRTEDCPDLDLCIAAARSTQKVADRNAAQQSETVLLDDVLTMPTLCGPVLSQPTHASQIQSTSGRTELTSAIPKVLIAAFLIAVSAIDCHADVASPTAIANERPAADTLGCSTKLLGKTVVATLNRVPFLTLSANGHSVTLILDTGAERTVLTPEAAQNINAQRPTIELQRRLHGIGGDLGTHEVELRSFTAGEVAIPWRRVLVAPVKTAKVFPTPLDGLLGSDVLSDFDVDLDLRQHLIGFYQKQSCPTAAPNWTGPYSTLGTGLSPGGRFFFPVQLDGHRLTATIDTGSQLTVLTTTAARSLGVTESALSRDRSMTMQGVAGDPLSSRLHRFAALGLGNLILRNPEIVVTDVNIREADLVLGVDLLSSRRVWLSYGSSRVFIASR